MEVPVGFQDNPLVFDFFGNRLRFATVSCTWRDRFLSLRYALIRMANFQHLDSEHFEHNCQGDTSSELEQESIVSIVSYIHVSKSSC